MQPKIPVNLISRFLTQINTRIDIFTTQNHTIAKMMITIPESVAYPHIPLCRELSPLPPPTHGTCADRAALLLLLG